MLKKGFFLNSGLLSLSWSIVSVIQVMSYLEVVVLEFEYFFLVVAICMAALKMLDFFTYKFCK